MERSPGQDDINDSGTALESLLLPHIKPLYPAALKDPRVSPLRAIKPGKLPPCFVICGTDEVLLPESRSIDAALREGGISCESHELTDIPHAFMMIGALSACREGQRLMFDFLRRHLGP